MQPNPKTFEEAVQMANAFSTITQMMLPVDHGEFRGPRYAIVAAPKVGDLVSRATNGDYYPAGKIVKVSHNYRRVETDDGTVFWRRRKTASWLENGCWSMVASHINERNPSF